METKRVKSSDDFAETCASIISGAITVFIVLLVTVFPLIYHDSYFDILETKYQCYYVCVIGMLAVCLVLAMIMTVIDAKEFQGIHVKKIMGSLAPKNWKRTFSLADAGVMVFWLVALISTLQSDYLFESFWGNEGRYTGLFLLTLYVAAYFLISRCWRLRCWCLDLFLLSGMVMCIIGITDYFQLDILDFRGMIKPEQSTIFTSTIGNINTYTAYVGLIMGFSAGMFAVEKRLWKQIWYYVCMVVAFYAIIMGCSDNAYLAIAALFGLIPFIMFKTREGVKRYLIMLATFFTIIWAIDLINVKFADMVIGLDSLFRVMVNFGGLIFLVIVLWALVLAFVIYERKGAAMAGKGGSGMQEDKEKTWGILLVRAWGIVVLLGIVGLLFMIYDANAGGNASRYGSLGSYLVFDDSWGTNRGYIWKQAMRLYGEFPVLHKLFGYGPDTFGILTVREIHFDMVNKTGQVFDSAHNEYLQYLITIGPIGLIAYLVFLVSSFRAMLKTRQKNIYLTGMLVALVCYAFQALVNINLPMATPIMWLMLSVGMAGVRGKNTGLSDYQV